MAEMAVQGHASYSGHKFNIVTWGLILPLSLGHKSQHALVDPAVLYQCSHKYLFLFIQI